MQRDEARGACGQVDHHPRCGAQGPQQGENRAGQEADPMSATVPVAPSIPDRVNPTCSQKT